MRSVAINERWRKWESGVLLMGLLQREKKDIAEMEKIPVDRLSLHLAYDTQLQVLL